MRTLMILAAALVLVTCGSKQPTTSKSSSPAAESQPAATKTDQPPPQTAPPASGASPVDFTSLGISADKQNIAYRIKVNTDKPIEEVHFALREKDAAGKVIDETTLVWQNIVKSKRHPIENGKTYEDSAILMPGVAAAELSLKEVIYKDHTMWRAPAGS